MGKLLAYKSTLIWLALVVSISSYLYMYIGSLKVKNEELKHELNEATYRKIIADRELSRALEKINFQNKVIEEVMLNTDKLNEEIAKAKAKVIYKVKEIPVPAQDSEWEEKFRYCEKQMMELSHD